ncbi:sulfite exporter TauE/SafE family protein [Leeia oryzae]|uniref:sulfite exporter TauE/SafE family protein n=1 Tax=Leeia oryzae TaxID=356662 RepID=UPI00039C5149|nr:sulfite exporter TauE/SafE family protein [Leeia oryzae]
MPSALFESLSALFIVGLLGGVHCIGMCGALVAAFGMGSHQQHGMRQLLLLNLGRLCTYSLLGALAGLIGAGLHGFGRLFPVQVTLYVIAQLMLIALGLYLAGLPSIVPQLEKRGKILWRHLQPRLAPLLPPTTPRQGFLAGLLWGGLPCGLVYSALTSAMLAGSVKTGALTMLAFGLGTLPNLLVMGRFSLQLRQFVQHPKWRRLAGCLVAALGIYGLWHLLLTQH